MLNVELKNNKLVLSFDKYSKLLLSVISLCLVLIVINLYFSPGKLNALETVQDVNIKSINGSSLWGSELPIELKKVSSSSEIDVNVTSINDRKIWGDKFPVDIQAINGQFIIGSELPVKGR
ncbi:MAG TPA: hypothetical protein VGK25_01155 [Ignavibacteria bacterium]|jgi:hypothetical protein